MSAVFVFFFFKQKTAYEMRISDWSSDVCSSDLPGAVCIATCLCKHAPIVRQAGLGGRKRLFRLARIAGKGRGLLACQAIPAGTAIERAPAVCLPADDRAAVAGTALFPYTRSDERRVGHESFSKCRSRWKPT